MELKKPVRSILVVPGHRADFAAKARTYGADQILWDLEDGVPAAQKQTAREIVAAHLRPGDAVRVNASPPCLGDPGDLEKDLAVLASIAIPEVWVWIAKAWGPPHLAYIHHRLPLARGRLCALVETPDAVLRINGLYVAKWTFDALAFGRQDFMAAAGLSPYQTTIIDHAAAQVALAALARGVPCYDSPCFSMQEEDVLDAAVEAKQLGFTGMGCIHPKQIPWVHRGFELWDAEQRWAREILDCGETLPPRVRAAKKILGVE